MKQLTVLSVFDDATSASIVKGFLESNGIECVFADEHISGIMPMSFSAFGGVKLLVKEDELQAAEAMLDLWEEDRL